MAYLSLAFVLQLGTERAVPRRLVAPLARWGYLAPWGGLHRGDKAVGQSVAFSRACLHHSATRSPAWAQSPDMVGFISRTFLEC
eukprot:scaffold263215_cov39-Prasinocladus_malaysianus.AAC.1